jgi:hypothetical protein
MKKDMTLKSVSVTSVTKERQTGGSFSSVRPTTFFLDDNVAPSTPCLCRAMLALSECDVLQASRVNEM